jgi:hypothetical protein
MPTPKGMKVWATGRFVGGAFSGDPTCRQEVADTIASHDSPFRSYLHNNDNGGVGLAIQVPQEPKDPAVAPLEVGNDQVLLGAVALAVADG